jgi:starch synthase
MRILFVAAEVTPVIKVGGLADVVGALPKALSALGHDVRVIIPYYQAIDRVRFPSRVMSSSLLVPWMDQAVAVTLRQGRLPETDVPLFYLESDSHIQHPHEISALGSVYANSGDPQVLAAELQRFLFFSRGVAAWIQQSSWKPDVLHLHDWHTSATAAFVADGPTPIPTVLTIHNLQNQGRWSAGDVFAWLGASQNRHPAWRLRDRLGNVNLLQVGIHASTAVNTVSPTYAQEILTPEYGEGLDRDLQDRTGGVIGILNGIDTEMFDPSSDQIIVRRYEADTVASGKKENVRALRRLLGLAETSGPLFVSVGRLAEQKGYHLIAPLIQKLVAAGGQVAILGTGVPEVELRLREAMSLNPAMAVLVSKFDASLAQLMYAGGDFFLMPSIFEPCGLGQMMAMRYGTLPVVRRTGGLQDTVIDIRRSPDRGTGFVFEAARPEDLWSSITAAIALYGRSRDFLAARQRAMNQDFSWTRSAHAYASLYAQLR